MLRRWLIRVPFLLPLAFIVGVWATSYFGGLELYEWSAGQSKFAGIVGGFGFLRKMHIARYPDERLHFEFARGLTAEGGLVRPNMLGFSIGPILYMPKDVDTYQIVFPLWVSHVTMVP